MHYFVEDVFIVEKGGNGFSLIPLQNTKLGRRHLIFGRQVDLKHS